jgi:hypothetical protein
MAQPSLDTPSSHSLQGHIASLGRRLRRLGAVAALGYGLVAAALLWLAAAWLDLVWELPPAGRIAASALALAGALVGAAWIAARWRGLARSDRLARQLDQAAKADGQIVSGYDLERAADSHGSPLTAGLANIAIERAARQAAVVAPSQVASSRPLARCAAAVAMVAVVILGAALTIPRLAQTQWLRFSDPFGDHPPFSRVQLSVEPADARVLYGAGLDVIVRAEGATVDQVDLVLRDVATNAEEVVPTFPEADGRWRALLTKVTSEKEYFARAARTRSRLHKLSLITVPQLHEVKVRVVPPDYARRPVYEGPVPQGGLAGLPGTKVRFWAKSNRPLRGGKVVLTTGGKKSQIELMPRSAGAVEVRGELTLSAAGKFTLWLTDVAGVDSQDRLSGAVTLLADQRPMVRIVQPPPVSLATPEATLPVLLSAEDDYGVARLELYRSLNQSRSLPRAFDVPRPVLARANAGDSLPLSAYALEPGDVIKLFARVEDTDPAGAKGSESPLAEVRIISQQQFEQLVRAREGLEVLSSKYGQARRRMEDLAERQQGLQKKLKDRNQKELSPKLRKELEELAKQLSADANEIEESARHLLPYDLDKNLTRQLEQLAKKLARQSKQLSDLQSQPSASKEDLEKLLEELAKELGEEREEFDQQATEPLEALEKVYPLIEDQARFTELVKRQRELAERLASLKGIDQPDDPAAKVRMRDLETEQRKVREALGELLDDIERHAAVLSDEPPLDDLKASALEFADAVRGSGASEAMDEAEQGLAEFSGSRAADGAQRAANILERFLSQCKGMGGKAGQCLRFSPGLEAALGDTVAQLLAEMGMNPGDGSGGGSGYSARRNHLGNTGLFGRMPGMAEGRGRNRSGPTAGSSSAGGATAGQPGAASDSAAEFTAGGTAGAAIPPRYRNRVGAYFQRIIEEGNTGDQK